MGISREKRMKDGKGSAWGSRPKLNGLKDVFRKVRPLIVYLATFVRYKLVLSKTPTSF